MNYRQLIIAREYRGLTQTQLSNKIKGLSQSSLSKFEKGLSVISESVQGEIINCLGFPKEFYDIKIHDVLESSNYRKRSVVAKNEIVDFELKCKFIGYIVDSMADSLEWPEFLLKPLNVEDGFSPKKVAEYTRKIMKLKSDEPVKDIYSLIERYGVIVCELDLNEKIDGVSFISDEGYPIIIVNENYSNDRKRFTVAHELGHILMHDERNFPISDFRTEKDKENEANVFASEFLMPENAIKNQLRGLMLKDLTALKNYWLTSMASIIRRAYDLKCIDANRYKYFSIEMSRLGYRKHEPGNVYIDRPKLFNKAYSLYKDELNYSLDDFVGAFKLPVDVIKSIFKIESENKVKVRVLNRIPVAVG
ncbi:XRE family transcriptional regulator [Myroides sp. DF42-4-2]|uniref:helix-turn-helix domain-containing protein n=1 Tax=unclassified Myroides TaxID=2642485 RepID=UPI002575C015|nr:XRE family transcriptional regulator [Myroides sp. DF42-4-2]MDM1408589.1 ImmA/IrrE family metallo-endopeptidase [Myroides sp. DF42-4-2]